MLGKVLTTAIAKAHCCGQLDFTLQHNDQIALVKQYAIPYVEITNVETGNQAMVVHIGYPAGTSMPGHFLHIVAKGYGRCRHGNYRAHMCIPDVTTTPPSKHARPRAFTLNSVVVMGITEPICASQTLQLRAR